MNIKAMVVGGLAVLVAGALASPMLAQEEKKAEKVREGQSPESLGRHWLARHRKELHDCGDQRR